MGRLFVSKDAMVEISNILPNSHLQHAWNSDIEEYEISNGQIVKYQILVDAIGRKLFDETPLSCTIRIVDNPARAKLIGKFDIHFTGVDGSNFEAKGEYCFDQFHVSKEIYFGSPGGYLAAKNFRAIMKNHQEINYEVSFTVGEDLIPFKKIESGDDETPMKYWFPKLFLKPHFSGPPFSVVLATPEFLHEGVQWQFNLLLNQIGEFCISFFIIQNPTRRNISAKFNVSWNEKNKQVLFDFGNRNLSDSIILMTHAEVADYFNGRENGIEVTVVPCFTF